jgi:3-isopropylmalate/(R)-2-methylmalate dehydratase small subunit
VRPEYAGATILVAGPNFGTGSSREHAVWALGDHGFRVVISPRFADIFRGNAGKNGLLTAVVEPAVVEQLWDLVEAQPGVQVEVDLVAREVRVGDLTAPFEVDDYTRYRLLEGLDDVDITLKSGDAIEAFEAERPAFLPVTRAV